MDLSKQYQQEDRLYAEWIQEVAGSEGDAFNQDEFLSYRHYEIQRKANREQERLELSKLTLSELYQRYVEHCAAYPVSPNTLGWQANGASGARWFDQGRLMLSLMSGYGRPATPVLMGATGTHS